MTRPANSPAFATAATFPAGANPWSSQPPRVAPSGAMQTQGFTPQADLAAEYVNYLIGNHGDWLAYHDTLFGVGMFGDGSDGSADLDGVNTYPWATLGGSSYTLSRDVNLTNLTIRTGIQLAVGGSGQSTYRVFGTGVCTIEGTGQAIVQQVGVGPGPTPSPAPLAGTVAGSGVGGAGQNAAGSAGTSMTNAAGGAGGAAGAGTGGAAGAAGTVTAPVGTNGRPGASFGQLMGHILGITGGVSTLTAMKGGAGGGGGGGTGALPGGAGGAGGGLIQFSFRSIVLANATGFKAAGGGGNPSNTSGGGGGGGGGGGYIRIICIDLSIASGALSAAVNCPGGAGGAANGAGAAGSVGANGTLEAIVLSQALPIAIASSGNRQTGVAVFATGGSGNGFDYVDVVLPSPFTGAVTGAGAYKIFLGSTYVYSGLGVPAVSLLNKTLTGFRLQPDVQFAGEIYWEVES